MKKIFSLIMVALLMGAMVSCDQKDGASKSASKLNDSLATEFGKFIGMNLNMQMSQDPRAEKEIDKAEFLKGIEAVLKCDTTKRSKSYLNGLACALQMIYPGIGQIEGQGVDFDRKKFIAEFKKAFNSKDSVDMMQMQAMQGNIQGLMQRAAQAKGLENDKAGQKYLNEQMKKDKGFKKTASGIAYKVIKPGKGENFNDSATVDVAYVGRHIDGKEFDNSQGKPVPFNMKQVVPGFSEILQLMNEGAKVIAIIPGKLAYGDQGNPQGGIGPNETLEFEMTAIGLHKDEPAAMSGNTIPAPAPKPGGPRPGGPKPMPKPAPKPAK